MTNLFSKLQERKTLNCKFYLFIRNFRINIEVNNQDDSGLKSSKPETSEDSLKNRNSENENNDQIILINKDSFDDECKKRLF